MGLRARTLDERLAALDEGPEGAGAALPGLDPGRPDALALWARAFSRGDREALRRRLAWDGLTEERVRLALGRPDGAGGSSPPRWAVDLANAFARFPLDPDEAAGRTPIAEFETAAGASPPPFAELWVPLVRAARARLERSSPGWTGLVQPTARRQRERHLLERLAAYAAMSAYQRFERFRERETGSVAPPPDPEARNGDRLYRVFVADMHGGQLARFLVDFPVLARHLQLLADTWVEATAELLERLALDLPAIRDTMGLEGPPGRVREVTSGLSDRHHRGRQVVGLTFESGLRLVYKPRPVAVEQAFADLVEWIGRCGLASPPATPRCVARPGHAWVEHVANVECASPEAVGRHYRQAGALLCLAWLLGGSDLHVENVIAGPDGPVLVDLETLLQPRLADASGNGTPRPAMARAADRVKASALATGLVGFFQLDPDGRVVDIGGFSGRGGYLVTSAARCFRHPNRDGMHLDSEPVHARPEQNLPLLDGRPVTPHERSDDVLEGFEDAYQVLVAHRSALVASGGPLDRFAGTRSRVVVRPSNRYALLQYVLAGPTYQRGGLARSLMIDALNSGARSASSRPTLWPLAAEERQALERLDIPYVSIPVDQTGLVAADGEVISGHFDRSGLQCARDRLARMSAGDLRDQLELLRSALAPTRAPGHVSVHERVAATGEAAAEPVLPPPLPAHLLEATAFALADEISERAIRGDDGSATWIAPSFLRREGRDDHGAPYYLYGGAVGVALFLAAASKARPQGGYAELCRSACHPLEAILASRDLDLLLANEGPGACNGLGGIVYALVWIGELLGEPRFLDLAARVAAQITPQRVDADERLDVEGGVAGAILGLLALHRRLPEAWVLDRATACGLHLLARQRPAATGGAAWAGPGGAMLAGFAHGAAGISSALARLHRATDRPELRTAAFEGVTYERGIFSPERGNWPVLERGRSGELERVWMTAWCHGAPGIALARATALHVADDADTRAEIETALSSTLAAGVGGPDHLCCGTLGRVDVVLTCGRILGRDGLVGHAVGQAALVVQRSTERGGFGVNRPGNDNEQFDPGFFRGMSGIAYELLRLARPSELPSVLAFEAPGGA